MAQVAPERKHRRSLKSVLSDLHSKVALEQRPELSRLVNWSGAFDIPIHRWLRYREAYSPSLITQLGLGQRILDPFCGCGSIMVGSAQLGRQSFGIDVNPLAIFAANVKLTPLSSEQITKLTTFLEQFAELSLGSTIWPAPLLSISNKVFEPEILSTILKLRAAIQSYSGDDKQVGNFLLLAWLAILEEVGSYFKEGNGIKYRNKKRLKDGYIRREEGRWQLERFGSDQRAFVNRKFKDRLATMILDTSAWAEGNWFEQKVIEGNALELDQLVEGREFDSVIFSPPYANRFDYFESLKVELWFGGFVNSYDELNGLRKKSLRSHLGANLTSPAREIEPLEQLISLMDRDSSSWRMRVPLALRGYFDDMFRTLVQCKKVALRGSCHIVVGNSAFAGVIIPTDVLIALLGLRAGYSSAQVVVVRHLTVAPQQRTKLEGLEEFMRESVVVLQ